MIVSLYFHNLGMDMWCAVWADRRREIRYRINGGRWRLTARARGTEIMDLRNYAALEFHS